MFASVPHHSFLHVMQMYLYFNINREENMYKNKSFDVSKLRNLPINTDFCVTLPPEMKNLRVGPSHNSFHSLPRGF